MSTPSPLEHGISKEKIEEVLQALNAGADVDRFPDSFEITPLVKSLSEGTPAITELLIMRGADVTGKDRHGMAPIHYAEYDTVELLLQHKADVNQTDDQQQTAIHMALNPLRVQFSSQLKWSIDKIKILLQYKPDLMIQDHNGKTPLQLAYDGQVYNAIALLEAHSASIQPPKEISSPQGERVLEGVRSGHLTL